MTRICSSKMFVRNLWSISPTKQPSPKILLLSHARAHPCQMPKLAAAKRAHRGGWVTKSTAHCARLGGSIPLARSLLIDAMGSAHRTTAAAAVCVYGRPVHMLTNNNVSRTAWHFEMQLDSRAKQHRAMIQTHTKKRGVHMAENIKCTWTVYVCVCACVFDKRVCAVNDAVCVFVCICCHP